MTVGWVTDAEGEQVIALVSASILEAIKEQGVTIDQGRGQAIVADMDRDITKAVWRVMRRLWAAATACEALEGRQGPPRWCEQPETALRDGRRVCRRHARAASVRWAP